MATPEGTLLGPLDTKDEGTTIFPKVGKLLETLRRNYFSQQLELDGSSYARFDQSRYPSFILLQVGCSFPPGLHRSKT